MKPTAHLTRCTLALATAAAATLVLIPAVGHAADTLAAAGTTGANCGSLGTFTSVQRTIVEKASQGAVPLIQYVQRTRMIHQLDLTETLAWLDERRALAAACRTAGADGAAVSAAE
jgi:hypothetical protein